MLRPIATLIALLGSACASTPDDGSAARLTVAALDGDAYAAMVHAVVEKDCGSASCHGALPRGLRVYGAASLRLPSESGAPVTGPTVAAEARATYLSIVGLEPEKLNAFTTVTPRSTDAAHHLLVLAKPLAFERHRGGISLRRGEPAEQCITSWLLGAIDAASCAAAAR